MARASGAQSCSSSGSSLARSVESLKTATSKREGSSAIPSKGFSTTMPASSAAVSSVTRAETPSFVARDSSMRDAALPAAAAEALKTTLPLFSKVRTSPYPRPSTTARRSAIATRLARPTLMPRKRATYQVIFKSSLCCSLCEPRYRCLACQRWYHQTEHRVGQADGRPDLGLGQVGEGERDKDYVPG